MDRGADDGLGGPPGVHWARAYIEMAAAIIAADETSLRRVGIMWSVR
jgi:hypothetical protein